MSPDGEEYPHRWLALIAVSMGVFIAALDVTVVGVIAPSLGREMAATATEIQWVFDAYTVIMAGFVIFGGGLAERFGRKGAVQLGMMLFAVGAAISALAPRIEVVIVGRVVSGLGSAVVFPGCLSITSALFNVKERATAIGIIAAISAAGMVIGPLLGGILIELFGWWSAFFIVVPVAVLSVVAMAIVVPPTRGEGGGKLDWIGAVLSVLALGGIVFAVIEGPTRGWANGLIWGPFVVGVVSAVWFVSRELRVASPLFDLRVFADPRVVVGGLSMAMVYFTFNSSQLLLPQYLVSVLNLSELHVGLIMSPFGVALMLLSPSSGRLVDRYGQRDMLVWALAFMSAGMMVLALLPWWGGVWNVIAGACVYGIGFGLIVAPATAAIMMAIPKEKAGDGSAVNMVSRQVGGAIGVAVTGAVAAWFYHSNVDLRGFQLTAEQTEVIERSLSGVDAVRAQLAPAVVEQVTARADAAMVKGVAIATAMTAGVTAIVAVFAFFLLPGKVTAVRHGASGE